MDRINTSPSRRTIIGGVGLATVACVALPTKAVSPTGSPDYAIEAAWERRQTAYAAFKVVDDLAEEQRLWAVVDTAEEIIRSTNARTPKGVLIQLWCALYHSTAALSQEQDDAVTRGDLDAVDAEDRMLDWNARLMIAAMRSLKAMEA
ncbi:hypothetical protein [Sphingomonas asaccharolytica]|uniref:hypothetical protein n=1 Tax=Sphingomonas asaccharolytica TaxID=40681 RepID=UPI00082E3342|nr:hypothetical protein [Sphingomonas asaccharolytica]